MTEDEAKLKWCPMVRCPVDPNDNGPSFGFEQTRCRGSACMMWRWHTGDDPESRTKGGICLPPSGYCGLAGKP